MPQNYEPQKDIIEDDVNIEVRGSSREHRVGVCEGSSNSVLAPEPQVRSQLVGTGTLVQLFGHLRRCRKQAIRELGEFVRRVADQGNRMSKKAFLDFLLSLPLGGHFTRGMCQTIADVLDHDQSGLIEVDLFTKSFNAYCNHEDTINIQSEELMQQLRLILRKNYWTTSDLELRLLRYSELGHIAREKLAALLGTLNHVDEAFISDLAMLLDPMRCGLIATSRLMEMVRSKPRNDLEKTNIIPEPEQIAALIKSILRDFIEGQHQRSPSLKGLFEGNAQRLSPRGLMRFLEQIGLEVTFLEAFCIAETLAQIEARTEDQHPPEDSSLTPALVYSWLLSH